MTIVAVYGTLKGMPQGKFIGHGVTEGLFHMWDGGFPVVLPTPDPDEFSGKLQVEVYAVNKGEKEHLDAYEGYPSLYGREKYLINLDKGDGTTMLEAWIYTGNQIKNSLPNRRRVIPLSNGTLYWHFSHEIRKIII